MDEEGADAVTDIERIDERLREARELLQDAQRDGHADNIATARKRIDVLLDRRLKAAKDDEYRKAIAKLEAKFDA